MILKLEKLRLRAQAEISAAVGGFFSLIFKAQLPIGTYPANRGNAERPA